ncbi:hypothetical protein Ait01nite_025260 [Actinoplanes italicus]|nr:hypothetical protein Ait01nite_025260 [Actinoplanes italicus]
MPWWRIVRLLSEIVGVAVTTAVIVHIGRRRLLAAWHGTAPARTPRPLLFWSSVSLSAVVLAAASSMLPGNDIGIRIVGARGMGRCSWVSCRPPVGYRGGMAKGEIVGDESLADGMNLSVRLRYDFTVTDAERLLAIARRIYRDQNPGMSADEASEWVSCAADVVFVLLEHAGVFGDAVGERLRAHEADGLAVGGARAQVVPDEPWPLSPLPRRDCLHPGDVFALPPETGSAGA